MVVDEPLYKRLKAMAVERNVFVSQLLEQYIKDGLKHDENCKSIRKTE